MEDWRASKSLSINGFVWSFFSLYFSSFSRNVVGNRKSLEKWDQNKLSVTLHFSSPHITYFEILKLLKMISSIDGLCLIVTLRNCAPKLMKISRCSIFTFLKTSNWDLTIMKPLKFLRKNWKSITDKMLAKIEH